MARTDDRLYTDTMFRVDSYVNLHGETVALKTVDGMPNSLLRVHSPDSCAIDPHCVIHDPTMTYRCNIEAWPYQWRSDWQRMDRICPHGVGHPDPDDLAFKRNRLKQSQFLADGQHGCDGCCHDDMEAMKASE